MAERRLSELETRFTQAQQAPPAHLAPPQAGPYDPYAQTTTQNSNFGPGQPGDPHAGYVSRAEINTLLARQQQEMAAHSALQQAHIVARLEAERDFPNVFNDPELRSAANEIWERDPYLRNDPRGPVKAAALAQALSVGASPSAQNPAAVLQRKAALSGVGPSIPSGSEASQQNDAAARYNQAMQRARYTQRIEDFSRARRIQLGLE